MTALLEIAGLKRHFGGLWATNGVDLTLEAGEIHALIGPNGAGKTTLIHLISGALLPDAGTLHFAGADITRCNMHERVARGITRSYQITQIFPQLSLLENVRLAVQARRRDWGSSLRFWRPASADVQMIAEAGDWLGRVGLAAAAGQLAGDVSHGERRALELAMALATRPRLLLLDEPLAGMGPEEAEHMTRLIAGLRKHAGPPQVFPGPQGGERRAATLSGGAFNGEQTVLLVEHDMDIVFRLADRISVLVAGRIIASGAPAAVRENQEVRRAYLGDEL
ncbi:MAG: ABC transporter ATP-binding protein [Rhodocyclaceae bacterium]|nr:ABC transporter ATP-binding protein [Rhodocyclaceae bacterium]